MLKHILKIIRNERRYNIGIWIELLIVATFLWFLADSIYMRISEYRKPLGFDIEHTYMLRLGYLNSSSNLYTVQDSSVSAGEQLYLALERIERNPMIEAASISIVSSPHIGSNSWIDLYVDSVKYNRIVLRRVMTPNFFHVFRYKSKNGSTDELVETFKKHELVLAPEIERELFKGESAVGKQIKFGIEDGGETFRVGAVSNTIRYDNWANQELNRYVAMPLFPDYLEYFSADNVDFLEYCVRVKPEEDYDFANRFYDQMADQLHIGNYYLSSIEYIPHNKEKFQTSTKNNLKTNAFVALFLLINIFLGITGTFWFRTQYRKSEIGLRISLGDTPKKILWKYYFEGLILLTLAMLPASILIYVLKQTELLSYYWNFTVARYFIGFAITYILLALMIILGIWFPARKAIKIPPSVALKDE